MQHLCTSAHHCARALVEQRAPPLTQARSAPAEQDPGIGDEGDRPGHEHARAVLLLLLGTLHREVDRVVEALDGDVVGAAFADVDSPGRLEVLRSSPTILVDAAHNPSGIAALVEAVEDSFEFTRLVGVVGILEDKDAEQVLAGLEPLLAEIVITRASSPRSRDVYDLAEVAVDVFGEDRVHTVERLDDAIDLAVQRAEEEEQYGAGVLVTGSITLVADARILLGRG